jgi:hypothetical protein
LDPSAHRPFPAKLVSSPFNPGGRSRGILMVFYDLWAAERFVTSDAVID